jgi:hypothetical protein
MASIPINIAVEDDLSAVVLRRLLNHSGKDYCVGVTYGLTGFGYLKRTVHGWNAAARGIPFVLLTDLDTYSCPPQLITDWLKVPVHPNLVFRVAVREVEAWLLADSDNLGRFLAVSKTNIPPLCETISDPKAALVTLARRSRSREIRDRVAPRAGSTAKQGPDYNACLSSFVLSTWDIDVAATKAPSLRKAVDRLTTFTPVWPLNNP